LRERERERERKEEVRVAVGGGFWPKMVVTLAILFYDSSKQNIHALPPIFKHHTPFQIDTRMQTIH
jgi:hypothetical protein